MGALVAEVATLGGNVSKIKQDKNWNPKGLEFTNIEIEIETESKEHAAMIKNTLAIKGYIFKQIYK